MSPFLETNSVLGITIPAMPGPKRGFALCLVCPQIQTGGRRWITDVKTSVHMARILGHQGNIEKSIEPTVHFSTQLTQSNINETFLEPGQHSFLISQMAFHKQVWSV